MLPIPLQPLQIQFHNLHLMSLLPPSSQAQASTTTAAPNTPPQPVPDISSETSAPSSTLRVPKLYPGLSRSPPHAPSGATSKQETSPQDPTPSPAPLLSLGEAARAEGIVGVHVPFSNLPSFLLNAVLLSTLPHSSLILLSKPFILAKRQKKALKPLNKTF